MKKIANFINKHYFLFLFAVVCLSFGQTLKMGVWMDDQGLFVKLMHLQERVGYLGSGPFGEGLYKYVITPFIPIYKIFGFDTKWYFALGLIFYFLSVLSIYLSFFKIFGKTVGKVSSFIYACGYIASDATIRLITSVLTSTSIIFTSFLFLFYWKFLKKKRFYYYFLALTVYFLAVEFAKVRTHYLVVIVLLIEVLYFNFKKINFKKVVVSVVRLLPFYYIYHKYFSGVVASNGNVTSFISDLLRGKIYELFGFFNTLTNLLINDWYFDPILKSSKFILILRILIIGIAPLILLISGKKKKPKTKAISYVLSVAAFTTWSFLVNYFFKVPNLHVGEMDILKVFIGGVILLFGIIICFKISPKYRLSLILFELWICINIGVYTVVAPTVAYGSISRYLAHSLLPLAGLLGIIFVSFKKARPIVIVWGILNIISAIFMQHYTLINRTYPVNSFFSQFESMVPKVDKGDVFYFDVSKDSWQNYIDAVAVASLPETASLSWRYDVDRYDITLFSDYQELTDYLIKNENNIDSLRAFSYSSGHLEDITSDLRSYLKYPQEYKTVFSSITSLLNSQKNQVNLDEPIQSIVPTRVKIRVTATPLVESDMSFPYGKAPTNTIFRDTNLRLLAFEYKKTINLQRSRSRFEVTSSWRNEIGTNLGDDNPETVWRPDRVLWSREGASLILDEGASVSISKFAWINAYPNSTPSRYTISVSNDKSSWKEVAKINSVVRIDSVEPQIARFDKTTGRYWKMEIQETLNQDAPGISEVWVIPSAFDKLDISEAEEFIKAPFSYLPDKKSYDVTVKNTQESSMQIYWLSEKTGSWQTSESAKVDLVFDGREREYEFTIPAGGQEIDTISFTPESFPGNIQIMSIQAKPCGNLVTN